MLTLFMSVWCVPRCESVLGRGVTRKPNFGRTASGVPAGSKTSAALKDRYHYITNPLIGSRGGGATELTELGREWPLSNWDVSLYKFVYMYYY